MAETATSKVQGTKWIPQFFSEKFARIYQTTQRHVLDDACIHIWGCGNQKFYEPVGV